MLTLQLVLAAAALAGHAHAHAHAHVGGISHHHPQSRSINARSLFHHGHLLAKRQATEDDAADGSFPPECTEQCNPYIEQGSKCAMKADGTVAEEDEIVACSCNADFFNSAIACMNCAPIAFEQDGAGWTAKDVVAQAIQSCKCMGYSVDNVDLSTLQGGDAKVPVEECYSGSPGGKQSEDTADEESSASDNAGTIAGVASTAQEDEPTSSEAPGTFVPATRSSTAASASDSTSASISSTAAGTGAASTVQAQQVLAFFIATVTSAMSFSYIS